jgi:hypothetical protein
MKMADVLTAEVGAFAPVTAGTYPVSRTSEAIGHVAAGDASGTVVISV